MTAFPLLNKKIWVAGHNGMVGSAVQRYLNAHHANCEVMTAARTDLDLTDQKATYDWLMHQKPDAIVLAAAYVGGIGANKDEPADFIYKNLSIQNNVIHGAYLAGVQKLLFLGSSCIYPKAAQQPITENALLNGELEPTNEPYAIAKIAGIKMCDAYRTQYGCDFISAMPCNLYGAGDYYNESRSHVIPSLIMKIHSAKERGDEDVTLWGTGKPLREFLYVDDLAEALVMLMQGYSAAGPVNIGSGQEISINDLAHQIAEIVGYQGTINFDPAMPDGTPRKIMNSQRMNALGWNAKTGLAEGLKHAYHDFLNRLDQPEKYARNYNA